MAEIENHQAHLRRIARVGFGYDLTEIDRIVLRSSADEIERLRSENAYLWERVKRWEPGADPEKFGSFSLHRES